MNSHNMNSILTGVLSNFASTLFPKHSDYFIDEFTPKSLRTGYEKHLTKDQVIERKKEEMNAKKKEEKRKKEEEEANVAQGKAKLLDFVQIYKKESNAFKPHPCLPMCVSRFENSNLIKSN